MVNPKNPCLVPRRNTLLEKDVDHIQQPPAAKMNAFLTSSSFRYSITVMFGGLLDMCPMHI